MPSALADIAAGLVIGTEGLWPATARPWALLLATLGIYHGALALNDWRDREQDRATRPDRPIPAGAISPAAALGVGTCLVLGGVVCAAWADARVGAWMAAVAACAVGYDLYGRGPWLGPLLLGSCRFGNLAAGLLFGHWTLTVPTHSLPRALLVPLLYGIYVFVISRMARLEDGEDRAALAQRPRRALITAALLLAAAPLVHPNQPPWWITSAAVALGAAAAVGLLQEALATGEWTPGRVGRATGMSLRRLLILTSCAALMAYDGVHVAGWVVCLLILLGYPFSLVLRKAFPPT